MLVQNGLYAAIFNEQRCGISVKLKIAEESRFQSILKDAAKKFTCVVEKFDRTAGTLCTFLLVGKLFLSRRMYLLIGCRP